MDQGLKERLVGAAVLIAVAVWLIPWVLDGPEAPIETTGGSLQLPAAEEPMPMRTQTLRLGEPEPSAESASVAAGPPPAEAAEAPPVVVTRANERTAADAPTVAAVRTEPERTPPVVTAPAPTPVATTPRSASTPAPSTAATGDWTVQLGVFGEEANARRLVQRTNTFGYKAEVSSYRSGDRTLYRVRVGNAKTRGEAEATASALKAHGLNDARVVAR
jgi:DedD protein